MLSFIAALVLMQTQTGDVPPDPEEAARLEEEEREAAARAEAMQRQAEDLATEVALMQRQLVELGQRVGASEQAALEAQASLDDLQARETDLLARLGENREALIGLLAAIQRIESQTPPAVPTGFALAWMPRCRRRRRIPLLATAICAAGRMRNAARCAC